MLYSIGWPSPDYKERESDCPVCDVLVSHSCHNYYSWWDVDLDHPLCSESCRDSYEELYGFEYAEEFDSAEMFNLIEDTRDSIEKD